MRELRGHIATSLGDANSNVDRVFDLLSRLKELPLSEDTIDDTDVINQLGNTLSAVRKAYTKLSKQDGGDTTGSMSKSGQVVSKATELMTSMKALLSGINNKKGMSSSRSASPKPPSSTGSSARPSPATSSLSLATAATNGGVAPTVLKIKRQPTQPVQQQRKSGLSDEQRAEMALLGERRQKVLGKFLDLFKEEVDGVLAELAAYLLETAINDLHPQINREDGGRAYSAKVVSMMSNLRKNKSLRSDLLNGKLAPNLLVTLSPEELATDEKRLARQKEKGLECEARRSDWIEENRKVIQEENGCVIEPGAEWEYSSGEESNCFEGFD